MRPFEGYITATSVPAATPGTAWSCATRFKMQDEGSAFRQTVTNFIPPNRARTIHVVLVSRELFSLPATLLHVVQIICSECHVAAANTIAGGR